jgi:general secretion pathway protein C
MPLQLGHLQQLLGETGIRRLALGCNFLLLGWIAWTVAQPIIARQQPDADDTQAAKLQQRQIARTVETPGAEQFNISSWHLFGVPSAPAEKVTPAKTNAPETRLNLELNGVYLGDDQPGNSRAIIAEKGKLQEHFRMGDQLPGNAVLDEIHADHVLLVRNGRYERLALTEKRTTAPGSTTARPSPRHPANKLRAPSPAMPGEAQSISELLKLQPVIRDGVFQGMTISASSGKGRLLLNNANVKLIQRDLVTAVNGIEILSADVGSTLLDNYTATERLELIIKRGDKRIPVIIDPEASH